MKTQKQIKKEISQLKKDQKAYKVATARYDKKIEQLRKLKKKRK